MKNYKAIMILLSIIGLSACSAIGTQFTKMSEPTTEQKARVRVHANMLVKGIPESSCVNWSKTGAGTIFGGLVGSSGYRGQVIGMPNPNQLQSSNSGEFYVAGDKPFTMMLLNTPESKMLCSIAITFVPETGHDYEIQMATSLIENRKRSICAAQVHDITNGQYQAVPIKEAPKC
ncbi:hypothetical protein [Volucribacter amazonae]|uniref:Uncharacterized protein n=1 Tax=Volucribacter amazonae TaxID=256731 RepID=A0A9X4SIF9_9PAST|nr:hypothetical protein [Volucribacter amazonae]MDG6895590.1 hypothetical protein [Volucribacter amazonae]